MKVYIDITNTYKIRLNTGIQRVAKELVLRLVGYNDKQDKINFVPVIFCDHFRLWKRITRSELAFLYEGIPEPKSFRVLKPLSHAFWTSFLRKVPAGSIFLDMDSSWHNRLSRRLLFKALHSANIKIIRLHHDLVPILFPQFCHKKTVRNYLNHLAAALTYVSLFVCVSKRAEEDLLAVTKNLDFSKDFETVVLRLGADFGAGDEKTTRTKGIGQRESYRDLLKKRGNYLLCVGTLEPRKNHALLLDVFEKIHYKFPWVKLVLIGKEGWNVDPLVKRITGHPLYDKSLFWFSDLDDQSLNTFYEHCVMSILPSFYEGYGLTVVESLMRGKIVLCSTGGSLPEVGEGYADYFDPDNAGALEELLVGYLSSPEKRRQKEKTIKDFRPYTWDESARNLIRILETFVSNNSLK